MTNALKYILEIKGMKQVDLGKEIGSSKQTISKWVLGKKPIANDSILLIETCLKVKRKHFADERRYCKILNEEEKLALDKDLLRQKYEQPTTTINRLEYYNNLMDLNEEEQENRAKYLHAYRQKKAKSEIQQLANGIKKDIQDTIIKNTEELHEDDLDMLEKNISFYDRLLSLRQSKQVRAAEWDSIFKALHMLTSEENDIDADVLTMEIYKVLKDNRTR